jgi:hypothetical protein
MATAPLKSKPHQGEHTMSSDKITLELDRDQVTDLQGMAEEILRSGGPLAQRAAHNIGNLLAKAMIEQIPGLKERAEEAIDEIAASGDVPEEIIEQLREKTQTETAIELPPISEEDIEATDIDAGLAEILGDDDVPEAG